MWSVADAYMAQPGLPWTASTSDDVGRLKRGPGSRDEHILCFDLPVTSHSPESEVKDPRGDDRRLPVAGARYAQYMHAKSHARRGLASVNPGWRRLRNRGVTDEGYQ